MASNCFNTAPFTELVKILVHGNDQKAVFLSKWPKSVSVICYVGEIWAAPHLHEMTLHLNSGLGNKLYVHYIHGKSLWPYHVASQHRN